MEPTDIKTAADVQTAIGSLTNEVRALADRVATNHASAEALARKADEAAEKARAAMEAAAAPKIQSRTVTGKEADLARYVGDDGAISLLTTRRAVKFAGRTHQVDMPGLLDDGRVVCDWQHDLQRAVGARAMARMVLAKGVDTPVLDAEVVRLLARAPENVRAPLERAFADVSGSGAEWIPDVFDPELYMAFEVPSLLEGAIAEQALQGPTIRPKITGQPRPYLVGAETADDSPAQLPTTSISTSNQTISPPTFGMRFMIGYASAEDSAILIQDEAVRLMIKGHRDGYEDCMVNGDTAGTHQDTIATWNIRSRWGSTGLGGANDHRRAFLGWRALAYDRTATVDQSAGQTVAKILEELVGGMGEHAAGDIAIVVGPEVYFKKLATDSNLLTVDKAGPAAATILRGAPASIGGKRILLTRFINADQAATGLYTGSGTYSSVLAVNTGAFRHYRRRGRTVELSRKANTQQIEIVTTERRGMDTLTASTEKVTFNGFKWLS